MTDTETKTRNAGKQLAGAVAGWESEGGASQPASRRSCDERVSLTGDEEHILQCLGAAVIVQWDDLPTAIQRQLFDHAASVGEPRHTIQPKEQIARFLHNHKDDARDSA